MKRLQDRIAVITGEASGIGLASARSFADQGAVGVGVDVNTDAIEALAKETGGAAITCDVTDEQAVEGMFGQVVADHGRVDVAFNNAGISPPEDDSILETGIEAWDKVQRVNLTSVYFCCKYVLPHMREQGRGAIINTASFVAVMGAAT